MKSIFYTVKKTYKRVMVEEYIPHEYDPQNPPEGFYDYNYEHKNYMLVQRPAGSYQKFLDSQKAIKSSKGKWNINTGDRLWGERGQEVNGLVNPVNGKRYDSRSKYYKDIKDAGCHISEGDVPKARDTQGDFNVRKELTEATRQVLSKQ